MTKCYVCDVSIHKHSLHELQKCLEHSGIYQKKMYKLVEELADIWIEQIKRREKLENIKEWYEEDYHLSKNFPKGLQLKEILGENK